MCAGLFAAVSLSKGCYMGQVMGFSSALYLGHITWVSNYTIMNCAAIVAKGCRVTDSQLLYRCRKLWQKQPPKVRKLVRGQTAILSL